MTDTQQSRQQQADDSCPTNIRELDEVDQRVLQQLVTDARNVSTSTLAEEVDVSAATIRNRINRLEEDDVIKGYHADIDCRVLGYRLTTLFVCTVSSDDRGRCVEEVSKIDGVARVRSLLGGRENLHVVGFARNVNDVRALETELDACGVDIEDEQIVDAEWVGPPGVFDTEK